MKTRLRYIFFILLAGYSAQAQHSFRAYKALADSLYQFHNYQDAADYYERAVRLAPDSTGIMLRIARAYSEMNNIKVSEGWYEKAISRHASFSSQDTYSYVKDLLKLERREDARKTLRTWLEKYPSDQYARSLLQGIAGVARYLKDSAACVFTPLVALNTPSSEFAPAFYRSGLLFTTGRPEGKTKRKYHWDKSNFLSLYVSERGTDQQWKLPVPFGREIHSEFHDGPAVLYSNNQRMMMNRNVQRRMKGTTDIYVSHLALVEAAFDSVKRVWTTVGYPFIDSTYSYAHPFITEDGKKMFFSSDMPGGYGGSDIYVTRKVNGQWQKPVNVGPLVNSRENEVFPYYIDHKLYFASEGHGGLGGLDVFVCEETPNGFGLAENLGYPINSHLDDFALITRDHQQGYLSSSRSGNDDLYGFQKKPHMVKLLARVYDGKSFVSLPNAQIEILTDSRDLNLVSGKGGYVPFELAESSAFIFVARVGDRMGVLSGLAEISEDRDHQVHEVALFSDTARVACVGTLKNETGLPVSAEEVQVVDEVTGEVLKASVAQSMVSFAGRRGHRYRVNVTGPFGNGNTHTVDIQPGDEGVKMWSMTLDDDAQAMVQVRIQVADENTHEPLSGAHVLVSTVLTADQELQSDASGHVTVSLPSKAAYMIVASVGDQAGMLCGFAEVPQGKNEAIDTVLIKSSTRSAVHGLIVVTDETGAVLNDVVVTLRDDATGEVTTYPAHSGAVGVLAQANRAYTVQVARRGYGLVEKKLVTSDRSMEKLPVTMLPSTMEAQPIIVRVLRQSVPVPEADVQVLTLRQDDAVLRTGTDGEVEFEVPAGEAYLAFADNQGSRAMVAGVADEGMEKHEVVHLLVLENSSSDSVYLYGFVTNQQGSPVPDVEVSVMNKTLSAATPAKVRHGVLSFPATSGSDYEVNISARDYVATQLAVPGAVVQRSAPLPPVRLKKRLPVTIGIADHGGKAITGLQVIVKDAETGETVPVTLTDGTLSFPGEQGKQYIVSVLHDQYQPVEEEVVLPKLSEQVSPRTISLTPLKAAGQPLSARVLMAVDKSPAAEASVKIISLAAEDLDTTTDATGAVSFSFEEGTPFMIMATKGDYVGMFAGLADLAAEQSEVLLTKAPRNKVMVITRITDEQRRPVENAEVLIVDKRTGEKVPANLQNGFLAFYGKNGGEYDISVQASGYLPATSSFEIKKTDELEPIDILLRKPQILDFEESLRVVRASDSTALPKVSVKIITLMSDDQELSADEGGITRFRLPEGAAYMAIAQQGNFYGVYSGEISSTSANMRTLVVNDALTDRVPVIGLLRDGDAPVSSATVVVTDASTGASEPVQFNNGILMFLGKKNTEYVIEVKSEKYETQVEKLRISPEAVRAQEIEITFTRRKMLVLPEGASLVVVNNEVPRFYVTDADTHDEIVEENGNLYLVRSEGKQLLGQGSLKDIAADPTRMIEMKPEQLQILENIYFDFNSTALDSADRNILQKTLHLLTRYPRLQMAVNTHADTRGSAWYNLRLTRRRARAVKHYLTHEGIKSRRIEARAYGKSSPAVVCTTAECNELQHQKNRRAEFEMSASRKQELKEIVVTASAPKVMKPTAKARTSKSYAELIEKYGARQKEGLVFEICVGAYRLNSKATFEQFQDLGDIYQRELDGLYNYYVRGYNTLREAEEVRQQVMLRGITDAYVTIFYHNERISFSRFISMTE